MNKLLHTLEVALPHWPSTRQFQYAQWVYGIWQILRCNPHALFVLSLPVYRWQIYYKEKKVIVVGETHDYVMPLEELKKYKWKTLTIEKYEHDDKLCFLKYGKNYYLAYTDCLRELAECERCFGENVVYVTKLLPITDGIVVGKMISQTEAYEKVLSSRGYHISKLPRCVAPSWLDYVDVSSRFWGFLSSISILLQAMSYDRVSALLSFVIILVDLNRHRLYRVYDGVFDRFVKFVKDNIFKKQKTLYYIFSFFSRRWNYAYEIKENVPIRIRPCCKLKSMEDLKINSDFEYVEAPKNEDLCVEIVIDRANVNLMQNKELYMEEVLNRAVYVPAINLQWQQQALWQHEDLWQQQKLEQLLRELKKLERLQELQRLQETFRYLDPPQFRRLGQLQQLQPLEPAATAVAAAATASVRPAATARAAAAAKATTTAAETAATTGTATAAAKRLQETQPRATTTEVAPSVGAAAGAAVSAVGEVAIEPAVGAGLASSRLHPRNLKGCSLYLFFQAVD